MDLIALRLAALIIPQNGRSQHFAVRVQQHQAVHLTRETDCFDLTGQDSRLTDDIANALNHSLPPLRGILFGPERLGGRKRVRRRSRAQNFAHLVDEQSFAAGGGNIKPQKVCHGKPSYWITVTGQSNTRSFTICFDSPLTSNAA